MKKPAKKYLDFLDSEVEPNLPVDLRAALINEFGIGHGEAKEIIRYWNDDATYEQSSDSLPESTDETTDPVPSIDD